MKQTINKSTRDKKLKLTCNQRGGTYSMCKKIVSRPELIYAMLTANDEQKNNIRDSLQDILMNAVLADRRNYVAEISIDLNKHRHEYEYIKRIMLAD